MGAVVATTPLHVNALDVELDGLEYIVTIGASNHPTTKWILGKSQALRLILKIAESEGLEVPFSAD